MTTPKSNTTLNRTPAYVSREVGAAEMCISPTTWDEWCDVGIIPDPYDLGISGKTPRWDWDEVRSHLAARKRNRSQCTPEAFFGALENGAAAKGRHVGP